MTAPVTDVVVEGVDWVLGVCHVALSPTHKDIALCGVRIPDEPWCCGRGPSCGRPRCDACTQAMRDEL